jgi:SAM-dependent methyltransferase
MRPIVPLHCLAHGELLDNVPAAQEITVTTQSLSCPSGCRVPVLGGIPRFVSKENYAAAFGHQWKAFRRTQLDSFTGTNISASRLERCLGGSFDVVKGKRVLEAGCGAGRFTEILLAAGAQVFACDLSTAVEANYENCGREANYFVCQADILKLPVDPGPFDVVICLGVIQHTPDPDEAIARLCSYVKPGGLLVIDHYRYSAEDMTINRQKLRKALIRTSPRFSLLAIRVIVTTLWPIHRLLWNTRKLPHGAVIRQKWLNFSPVLDYHDDYIQLGPKLLYAWAMLDTHDALTDRYKHKRTTEQIAECLQKCGMQSVEVAYGGNGVEARARKAASSGDTMIPLTAPRAVSQASP